MRTPISATALSRRSAVALAIAALAVTAACRDDHIAGPKSAPQVSAPNATIYPIFTQEVTVRVKDIWGNLIQDGMIPTEWLALGAANDTVLRRIAYDNHLNPNLNVDLNPLLGVIALKMPMAYKQKVCLYNMTTNYSYDVNQPSPCNQAVTNNALKIDLGTLVMRRKPVHTFYIKDMANVSLLGVTSLHITGPYGFDMTYVEGGAMDPGAADGKIVFRPYAPGTYDWCEVTAPAGYKFTSPKCGSVTLSWEGITSQTLSHKKI